MKNALWMLLLLTQSSIAATIAVIDSGVDVEHNDLVNSIWINELEIADNGRDEDRNGYQDDVFGWNFAEQNNLVIDRKYIGTFSHDPYKFFEIQGRMFMGTATAEDKEWLDAKRKDPNFAKEMGKFGNFVHGTHVAGITVEGNSSKILSVKLIPTEVKPFINDALMALSVKSIRTETEDKNFRMMLVKGALKKLAQEQAKMMEAIFDYVGKHGAEIANGSFGTGFNQAKMITGVIFKTIFFRDATNAELAEVTKHFLNVTIDETTTAVNSAKKTLFVFAAGNDNSNNDIFPTSPTNIRADNVISVAATYKQQYLAPFSNYGPKMVDIAAPGMLIHSQIPGNEYLKVSGTSQAAPYIANVASMIKDANPALKPLEIKQILMGTVDLKKFLSDKVKSKGIVNLSRALFAAKMSLSTKLEDAISESRISIQDLETEVTKSVRKNINGLYVMPLQSQFSL